MIILNLKVFEAMQTLYPQNRYLKPYVKQVHYFKLGPGKLSSIISLPTGNVFLTLFWGTGIPFIERPSSTEVFDIGGIYVSGQQFEISHLSLNTGEINIIQIELTPNAIHQFFGIPQRKVANRVQRLEDIWSNQASEIYHQVTKQSDLERQLAIIERFLIARMHTDKWRDNPSLAQANCLINQCMGNIGVKDLATSLNTCTRSLERMYLKEVGISPKAYCKLIQFNYAFRQLVLFDKNILDISFNAGYYDQPHFVNHFRKICGMGPGKFFERHEKFLSCLKKTTIKYSLGPISYLLNTEDSIYIF